MAQTGLIECETMLPDTLKHFTCMSYSCDEEEISPNFLFRNILSENFVAGETLANPDHEEKHSSSSVEDSSNYFPRSVTPVSFMKDSCEIPSPITPTTNLKILMSVVSPELRNREKARSTTRLESDLERNLFAEFDECDKGSPTESFDFVDSGSGFTEHSCENNLDDQDCHVGTADLDCPVGTADLDCPVGTADQECPFRYAEQGQYVSRKEKSLGLLCQKFIAKYPAYVSGGLNTFIGLDEIAKELGVERRRIYDIVNVLESVEIVSRVAKNLYLWHGRNNLSSTLYRLKALGESDGLTSKIHKLLSLKCDEFCENNKENVSDDCCLPLQ